MVKISFDWALGWLAGLHSQYLYFPQNSRETRDIKYNLSNTTPVSPLTGLVPSPSDLGIKTSDDKGSAQLSTLDSGVV